MNIGSKLAKEIKQESEGETKAIQNVEMNNCSMFLSSVDEKEILKTVNNLKPKTSTDNNKIDMIIVKKVIEMIVKPLNYIFNLSFQTGIFPQEMKIAKVVPVYKVGDRHSFTNYRPVSILPQFSKILEKLFMSRLDSFIDKHALLSDTQYGFRAGRSTSLALLDLVEEITECLDKKMCSIGVFLDFSKAFDTINRSLLI